MARNTKPTSSEFDYTVVQEPLFNRDGKAVKVGNSPIMGNFRTDNNVCLGTSTEAYEIVNNESVVEVVEDAFAGAGLGDFEREIVVAREGARFYGVYDFPTQERHIANVGDVVSLRLTLNNSFDRSCGLNWAVGMMRKVCSNGMCSLVADTNVTKNTVLSWICPSLRKESTRRLKNSTHLLRLLKTSASVRSPKKRVGSFWTTSPLKRCFRSLSEIQSRWFGIHLPLGGSRSQPVQPVQRDHGTPHT